MKKWFLSRTLWINFIAMIALFIQTITGKDLISPEMQAMILTVINLILRIITKNGLY